jgi:putative membrane protein
MLVSRNLRLSYVMVYTWKPMLYFTSLSLVSYVSHASHALPVLTIPFNAVATLSTALGIYLGFKNNNAYDRWWEARKIWGALVNQSRAWARQALTLALTEDVSALPELRTWQRRVIYRHIAFVHAMRVVLRCKHHYNTDDIDEPLRVANTFDDLESFLSPEELREATTQHNPPNHLNKLQGEDLKLAYKRGWLSDYRYVRMDETLSLFNDHQGMSERIKNTPLPRPYSYYSRVFVLIHGTLVPFAFIEDLGWANVPLSLTINFMFLALDQVGGKIEDPFENRMFDIPLTAISLTIEENLKEMLGETKELPAKPKVIKGVVM